MSDEWRSERSVAGLAVLAAVVAFVILVAVGGPFYETFDEAKYVGLGRNLYAGLGYSTVFGGSFLTHPPGWPLILVGPESALGIDPFSWGRIVNVISGAGLIAMAGWIGWSARPAVGGLAAIALLGFPYLADLSRTARLDVPGAAVTVLAVIVGVAAIERGSVWRAIAAGALFAVAFLIKETSLVFLAVPVIATVIGGQRLATIARLSAWTMLVIAFGGGWWFMVVAAQTGLVYRTSLPAWVLVPGAVALAVLIGLGLGAERIVTWVEARRTAGSDAAREGTRIVVGLGLAVAWAAALLVVFARSPELGGAGLIDRIQISTWLATWGPTLRPVVLFVGGGTILGAIAAATAGRNAIRNRRRGLRIIGPAVIVSVPLLLFVVATGEPPRNDFASLTFAVALGASGWIAAEERIRTAGRPILAIAAGAAVGAIGGLAVAAIDGIPSFRVAVILGAVGGMAWAALPWLLRRIGVGRIEVGRDAGAAEAGAADVRGPSWTRLLAVPVRHPLPVILVFALLIGTGTLAIHVRRTPGTAADSVRGTAVRTITDWIRSNEPTGTTIAVGSLLGNEVAIALGGYPAIKLSAVQAGVAAGTPLGLSVRPGDRIDDWIAVDPHPRKTDQFLTFSAAAIVDAIRARRPAVWIYITGESTAAPSIVPSLTPDHGFDVAAHWSWLNGRRPLEAWVFRIDEDRLGFADAPLRISSPGLSRLVTELTPLPDGPSIARALVDRIALTTDDEAGRRARADLEALAGRG